MKFTQRRYVDVLDEVIPIQRNFVYIFRPVEFEIKRCTYVTDGELFQIFQLPKRVVIYRIGRIGIIRRF